MSTLALTSYSSGAVITSSGQNANLTAISNWANGNIGEDNLDTLAGTVTWSVSSNVASIVIANSGTEGAIQITNNTNLAAGKAVLKVTQNNTGPALDVVSTTGPARLPRMTTTQRDAISAAEGDEIYNTTLKRKEIYNGSYWVSAAGDSGRVVQWPGAGTLPSYLVECDGSTLAVNGTNAYAISILSTTWGSSGTLPDLRGRTVIGAGTGQANYLGDTNSALTNRVIATANGRETHTISISEMPSHNHGGGSHTHTASQASHQHYIATNNSGGSTLGNNSLAEQGDNGTYSLQGLATAATVGQTNLQSPAITVDASGSIISSQGSGSAHENMQPSVVVRMCMVL